jgi:hypothetical protein
LFKVACKKHGIKETDKQEVGLLVDYAEKKGYIHVSTKGGTERTKKEVKITAALKDANIKFAGYS